MKIIVNTELATPVYQQIVDQIHFAISAGELKKKERLPSIRTVAKELGVAPNTVAKAYRKLEFRGLIKARSRASHIVEGRSVDNRYGARGVSADKTEVYRAVDKLEQGLFP